MCCCTSLALVRWWQKTDFNSTFLASPIQVEATVRAPSQTFVSKWERWEHLYRVFEADWTLTTDTINKRFCWNFGENTKNEWNKNWSLHITNLNGLESYEAGVWIITITGYMIFILYSKSWCRGLRSDEVELGVRPASLKKGLASEKWEQGERMPC